MSELIYYQRNIDVILNRANDYYENDKDRLRKQARHKYRNFSEEDKNKKGEFRKKRYHNMAEEKNNKKITVRLKSLNIIINIFYRLSNADLHTRRDVLRLKMFKKLRL